MKNLDLVDRAEKLEKKWSDFLYMQSKRLVRSFFGFKGRKGEFAAATVTFYTLMSFTPLLLLVLYSYTLFIGDSATAYEQVFNTLKNNFPNLAPWIVKSIEKIIQAQMAENSSVSYGGVLILLYACFGFASSLNYGLYRMANENPKGGKIVEEVISFFSVTTAGLFSLGFIYVSSVANVTIHEQSSIFDKVLRWGHDNQLWQIALGFSFFTLFFKWLTPIRIRWKDATLASIVFVSLFYIGKTFYWVYLKHFQGEMIKNFGDFYTIVEAVIWIYFLACSFFFAASAAYEPIGMRKNKNGHAHNTKNDQNEKDITLELSLPLEKKEDLDKAA